MNHESILKTIFRRVHCGFLRPCRSARMGALAVEPAQMTPDQLGAFMAREIRRWNKVAKDANIRIEQ